MKAILGKLWSGKGLGWQTARIGIAAYAGLLLYALLFQDRFLYFPAKAPVGNWDVVQIQPGFVGYTPKIEDRFFAAADGVRLHAWWCTPVRTREGKTVPADAKVTLLLFHGNSGNVTDTYDLLLTLVSLPANILAVDYRGYGKSQGTPSEEGLYSDGRGAWDEVTGRLGVPADRVILFGDALGSAVAVDLATRVRPAGLIVQSGFTSMPDLVHEGFPILPRFIVRARMDSLSKIRGLRCPAMFVHGTADESIPYDLGRRLFEAAPDPKRLLAVRGASHLETFRLDEKEYLKALRGFLRAEVPGLDHAAEPARPR